MGLSALAGTLPAHSFELFGIKLFGGNKEAEEELTIGEPQPYNVDFAVADTDGLESKLKSASSLWGDREDPASGAAGLIAKARSDYRRLLATLYSEGRYGGTISIRIDGREAADLPPDATLANPAAVLVSVDPGPLFHFGEAAIVNEAPPPTNRKDSVDNPHEGFMPGEVARSGTILRAERLSVEAWRQQGHAKARVADRRVEAAHNTDIVNARIALDPGRKAYYGPVTVDGTERMDPQFVAWMTGLRQGEEYDPDDIERASKRIARLDVFRAARFQEADMIGENGLLPITMIVQERLPRRFGVGGTYSTVDGLGLESFWLHRNLFGRAERLRFDAKVAGIGKTFKPEEFTYRFGPTFVKPGVFTPDTDFTTSLIGDREVLDAYTRTAVTGTAGFTHIFTEELSGKLLLSGGHAQFEDDEFGTRDFTTVGLLGGLTYDSRDNPADATSGFYVDTVLEPFYEFQYGNGAFKATAEGRAYFGFGEKNRFVLAGRLKVGALIGPETAEISPDKLFFAGGGGSVRGYAYRNIGVRTPDGNIIGGRSLAEASVEARVRVTNSIGLVGFVDAGYVDEDTVPSFNEDLRIGVGAGLRYLTGLGPIRLDVAVPLDRRSGDPSVAFYVGIGQAF
ncbi:autotransporter assembly complex family protein [Aquamicrobium sp. LC103]|uniref:autotransporter assembly complex protein TamA n=1 Tax=Aquamicrobium sp. LC103 TaxID=1120658 RepID=UPI001FEE34D9|nr:autotransporter assembly complex family protein [Aquamicrobium sp. LC103]